jgi:hypothetical protein
MEYVRVLPSFVVDLVLKTTLCIIAFVGPHISDFGLVEQLMMEAKDLLVPAVRWL